MNYKQEQTSPWLMFSQCSQWVSTDTSKVSLTFGDGWT